MVETSPQICARPRFHKTGQIVDLLNSPCGMTRNKARGNSNTTDLTPARRYELMHADLLI